MGRFPQKHGERGSLKWIQRTVANPALLDGEILKGLPSARSIIWRSPLASDEWAEYRDREFLERIGHGSLASSLQFFWPNRGPQWDALACSDAGDVLLVEAKAHIDEICSSPLGATAPASIEKIRAALQEAASYLEAEIRVPWEALFYQITNRLAHLYFLRKNNVRAWLVLVNFLNDHEMNGPRSEAEWEAAYLIVWHVLGLPKRHKLSQYIIHAYPDVRLL
jgi:hypothetical protein